MDIERIIKARDEALAAQRELKTRGEPSPSLDALFLASFFSPEHSKAEPQPWPAPIDTRTIPQWFIDGLKSPHIIDRRHTARQLLSLMGRPDAAPNECRAAGIWLTRLGHHRRKSNGRVVFFIARQVCSPGLP